MSSDTHRWIIGCMTGTSLDGLDAALANVIGTGLDLNVEYVGMRTRAFPPDLRRALGRIASGDPSHPIEFMRAAHQLGVCYADVAAELRALHSDAQLDFVVAHGQTIWHAPDEHLSWQLLNPTVMAHRLGVPVLCDLRQADLVAGGQGAPLTPLSDWVLYRCCDRDRLIANLGGILNVTDLAAGSSPGQISGRDVGPCNLLIDGVVRKLYPDLTYDIDGHLAEQGRPDKRVYDLVHAAPFYTRTDVRSTGREDFSDAWINTIVTEALPYMSKQDVIASAVDAVARDVASGVTGLRIEVVLAGGGVKNRVLTDRIRYHCPEQCIVTLSDELGIPATAREALCLAVLGALCQDGVPITLPQVTGADCPQRAGLWVYP